ncbi:helicase DnaB [Kitasatospora acidiphila]|uniref:Helicase DnaB n=1 Tax=Kitasatospora acidiphila TaxID=2567942 RepID=A0A540VZ25_9ACTN|nr:DnaB-like helicase N-terminal domain-containing protein [Kitasatospora acidiphila]TQF02015.1 helicase DnaB [Kitasatospora acidiphila]
MDALLKGEQAVLGAVLLDPAQLDRLSWLTPADFYRPAHRALFAAMRTVRTNGLPALDAKGNVPLSWVTDILTEAGRHVRGLTASYPHTLIAACPRAQNAPVYGRMVLEGSIHRTVLEHAVRLEHVARTEADRQEVEGVLHQADVLTGVLGDLARRWGSEPRPVPLAGAAASSKPSPVGPEETEEERFLLAVLVSQPGAMAEVYDWLRPGDFADAGHGQVYRCLGALHHRGEPIDNVTALWEVQRRGLLAGGTLSQDQLDDLFGGPGAGSAEWLGEQLLRSSLTRTAAGAALRIAAHADDQRLAPGQLIGHALHALDPLDDIRARWGKAGSPPQPQPLPDQSARVSAALTRSPQGRPSHRRLPAPQTDLKRPVRAAQSAPLRPHGSPLPGPRRP